MKLHSSVGKTKIWNTWNLFFKNKSGILIDCTTGFGGHSLEWIIFNKRKDIRTLLIDLDKECFDVLKETYTYLNNDYNFSYINNNFKNIKNILFNYKVKEENIAFVLDLGLNNLQEKSDFFSYHRCSNLPFDLRLEQNSEYSPAYLLIKKMYKNKFLNYFKEHTDMKIKNLIKIYDYFNGSSKTVLHRDVFYLFKHIFNDKRDYFLRKFYYLIFNLVNNIGRNLKEFFNGINILKQNKIIIQILAFSSLEREIIITQCYKHKYMNIEKKKISFKQNKTVDLLTIRINN